ncbi:prostate-associated microseminoprotein [Protopterus annectens]|uniref:prostate-associated microseminoprotein n=1 Tax=Protopterus annectens TaxID=7888 RepID=UPI001CFA2C1F|nr:prostate-associated microseminoprotein [Protopterus annectens]
MALYLLFLLLQESHGECHFQSKAVCEYAGRDYKIGESWMSSDCMLCTCLHPEGVGCCKITQHPIDFPEWCEAQFNQQSCQIYVVQKANPSLPCVYWADHQHKSTWTKDQPFNKLYEPHLNI